MIKPKRRWAWTHKNTRKSRSVKYLSSIIKRYRSSGHFKIPKVTRTFQKGENRAYVKRELVRVGFDNMDEFDLIHDKFLKEVGVWDDPFW